MIFEGNKKSRFPFPEYFIQRIPAEILPVEIKTKYSALKADIAGNEDQNEVIKNQMPGRRMIIK
jgi:hypothetical protein